MGISATLRGGNYVLANDIDASGTSKWNSGAGFVSIGSEQSPFTGSLDGKGRVIDGRGYTRVRPRDAAQGAGSTGSDGSGTATTSVTSARRARRFIDPLPIPVGDDGRDRRRPRRRANA